MKVSRRLLTHLAVGGAGFLLMYAVVALFIFPATGESASVRVPSVVGLAFDDAKARLKDLQLNASLGESRVSGSVAPNTVLSQAPSAGGLARHGDTVVLTVSSGPRRATVPSLTGLTQGDAVAALRAAGLEASDVREEASDQPRGTVLQSEPDAGQVVPMGARVVLVVSGGPSQLVMPDVTGRNVMEARSTLEQLGLTLATTEYDSTSALPEGAVVAQSPAAGVGVLPGTGVILRVSGRP